MSNETYCPVKIVLIGEASSAIEIINQGGSLEYCGVWLKEDEFVLVDDSNVEISAANLDIIRQNLNEAFNDNPDYAILESETLIAIDASGMRHRYPIQKPEGLEYEK